MQWIILGIISSYLLGCVPTAYIFGRITKGIDIRKFGSGNVGATNALRVLGKKIGVAVLIIDIIKGFIPAAIFADILVLHTSILSAEAVRVILGISCIAGHNWIIFLGFKGGKGVASTIGVLLALAFRISGLQWIFILVILSWLLIFLMVRIVSIASVIAFLSLPLYMIVFKQSPFMVFSALLLAVFIAIRHINNLKRFFQGKEPRLHFKKTR